MAPGAPPWLVKVGPPPWSALLRPGLSSVRTEGAMLGAHEVLPGALVVAAAWVCVEEEKSQSGLRGVRLGGSGSTEPVKLPL